MYIDPYSSKFIDYSGAFQASRRSVSQTTFLFSTTKPASSGGGAFRPRQVPSLTAEQRQQIHKEIDHNVQRLGLQRSKNVTNQSLPTLSWPVQPANGVNDYGYYGISAFVDHNPAYPNKVQDYNCGSRSYDLSSGYNHAGTDIFPWPFSWQKMDNDQVEVIAAASGTIVFKQDGKFDRNCWISPEPWNAIYIQHADGSVAWYGHLKKGSVTSKPVGATVAQGEYLGVIGSSGNSTGPHLHFELYDAQNKLIDPYLGPCNSDIDNSLWDVQKPYYDSAINKLTTGDAPAEFPTCPLTEEPHEQDQFSQGDLVYFTAYYRDQLSGQQAQYTVYEPNGAIYQRWFHSSTETFTAYSNWWWSYIIPAEAPGGTWTFEVVFEEKTYEHEFSIADLPSPEPTETSEPTNTPEPTETPEPAEPSTFIYLPIIFGD